MPLLTHASSKYSFICIPPLNVRSKDCRLQTAARLLQLEVHIAREDTVTCPVTLTASVLVLIKERAPTLIW